MITYIYIYIYNSLSAQFHKSFPTTLSKANMNIFSKELLFWPKYPGNSLVLRVMLSQKGAIVPIDDPK